MADKLTHDEEMKIRHTWGDYVAQRGFPSFRDKKVDIPVEHEVSPFVPDAAISMEAVINHYTYVLKTLRRARDWPLPMEYHETTVECQGVVVHREWVRDR